jgi:tetratricopeptide (TPR) repeat protein
MIVARDGELVRLTAILDAVASGVGRAVFLAGEPGVGKTRLAQEVTLAGRNRAFLVASGSCYEADQSVPYYPFLEALSALLAQAPEAIRSSVPERWQQVLRLLPNQDWTPVPSNDTQDEQLRLFWAVTEFVLALADLSPVAILIDDLHWSDASSLALFEHLARHTRTHPVLLLGTYRDVEVGRLHPLERTLLNLGRQRLMERVAVKRLTESGTAALMASTVGTDKFSPDFSGLVYRRTDGNPFFVEEVLRALVERGDVYRENGQWERRGLEEIEVPESVRSVIGQRLSRLTESTQEVLRDAAVLGLSFGFGDLQSITDRPETEVESAVEEAKSVALLRESGPDHYAFNHALTQQALYEELSLRRKRRLHLAAAASLEQLPEAERRKRASELARHLLQGDDLEAALPYALLAGDQAAAVFAHFEAQEQFRMAAELAADLDDTARTGEALTKLGRTLFYAGRSEEALVELARAAEIYGGLGDIEAEALSVAQMGWCHFEQGTPEDGIPRLEDMIARAEAGSLSACLAALYSAISNLYYLSGRYRDQLAASERAVALSWVVADDRLRGQAEVRRGMALMTLGRLDDAIKAYQTAIPLAEAAQDLDTLYRAYSNLNLGLSHSGRIDDARESEQRLYALDRRIGNPAHTATLTSVEGWHFWMSGDWPAAQHKFELALKMFRSSPSNRVVLIPRVGLAVLDELEGDVDGAVEELESVLAEGRRTGNVEITAEAEVWLCWAYIARGQIHRAVQHLQEKIDQSIERGVKGLGSRNFLVYALCELGDYERAVGVGASVVEDAGDVGSPFTQSLGRIFYGRALGGVGRFEESRDALEEGIRLAHDMPFAYAEGLGQLEYGRMLHQQNENALARERLGIAAQIFDGLGAKRELDRTNSFLSALS